MGCCGVVILINGIKKCYRRYWVRFRSLCPPGRGGSTPLARIDANERLSQRRNLCRRSAGVACRLLQNLQANILEMYDHAGVVQLQLYHALVEAFFGGQIFCELRGEPAVDEELEVIAPGYYVNRVPIPLVDIFDGQGVFDGGRYRLVVGVNHQPDTARAVVFRTAGRVEIPGAQNLPACANMSEIGVVALKMPLVCLVRAGTDADTAVALAGKAVTELEFQIGDLCVFKGQVALALVAVTDNHAIPDGPRGSGIGRHRPPAVERFAVENGHKTVLVRVSRLFVAASASGDAYRDQDQHGQQTSLEQPSLPGGNRFSLSPPQEPMNWKTSIVRNQLKRPHRYPLDREMLHRLPQWQAGTLP